jgi:hypothetical protein
VYNGPPGYLLDPNRRDEFADPEFMGGEVGGGDRGDVPDSAPAPPVKPNNHRYLPKNPSRYGGADPRRYRNEAPETRTRTPWPESRGGKESNAPGPTDLSVRYNPIRALNGPRISESSAAGQESVGGYAYDEFALPPNTVRGSAVSYERSTARSEKDNGR